MTRRAHPGVSQAELAAELLAFERLLASLIATFVDLPAERVEQELEGALMQLLNFLKFDRGSLAEVTGDGGMNVLCSVAVEDVAPLPLGRFPDELQWYLKAIHAGETIVLHRMLEDLPPDAHAERRFVEATGMRSHVSIPLRVGQKLFGAIGFASFGTLRVWHPDLIGRLKMIGEVLASALARTRAQMELRHAERELHQLRSDLWHADRAQSAGALTGSLAHELNQPLTAILSNAQAALRFLDRGAADEHEIREILEAIVREDKRAGAVIRGLRAILRREEGARSKVDLAEAIDEVLLLMRGELEAQHVQLETRFERGCVVLVDRTQIQQVAINLIKNAVEAMASRPRDARRMRIAISRDGLQRIKTIVRDSGVGLAEDRLPTVFRPYASTKEQGMGLGLSIVRAIVEAHGGEIGVERNQDHGVTFAFTLPAHHGAVAEHVAVPDSRIAAGPPEKRSTAKLVWVVDDDPAVRDSLRRLLVSAQYAVETFSSPRDFLQRPTRQPASCLLLDVALPELSGPEFYARLRSTGLDVPTVFLTGRADVSTGIDAMKQGAVDYLLKPVDDDVLLQTVALAVLRHGENGARQRELQAIEERFSKLSPRERDVMHGVVGGLLNKQIAAKLGISEATVKQHRGRVMDKMKTRSLAELVRMVETVDAVQSRPLS